MGLLARFLHMDRRIIFLLVGVAMVMPLVRPFRFPGLSITPPVEAVYNRIENLPPKSNVLVSFDFDPASKPELEPQARALLTHAFRNHLDVVVVGLWVTGQGLAQNIVRDCARDEGAREGEDYAFLGWQPGGINVIIGLGQDIATIYPKDVRGKATADLPLMQDIHLLKDFQYMVCLGAGSPGIEDWIVYGTDKHGVDMAAGTTSINATGMVPYLQTGQLKGLMNGMKGGAEYEKLIGNRSGKATGGMDSMALGALLIIALVLAANMAAFLSKGKGA